MDWLPARLLLIVAVFVFAVVNIKDDDDIGSVCCCCCSILENVKYDDIDVGCKCGGDIDDGISCTLPRSTARSRKPDVLPAGWYKNSDVIVGCCCCDCWTNGFNIFIADDWCCIIDVAGDVDDDGGGGGVDTKSR